MWGKNVTDLPDADLDRAKTILAKYNLRVTDIASPLFKTDWPGAPLSKLSEHRDQFKADFTFKQQEDLLEHCITLAKTFRHRSHPLLRFLAARKRCALSRWPSTKSCAMPRAAAHGSNLILLLENEMSCNTATGGEAAATLRAVPEANFMLNWDPGNAATFPNSEPFPNGYNLLPKKRIGHCHAKNVVRKPDDKWEWAPVGTGVVDWPGQLAALQRDGYRYAVSLETHWRGAGTPEASTRESWNGLKDALIKSGAGTGCFA